MKRLQTAENVDLVEVLNCGLLFTNLSPLIEKL